MTRRDERIAISKEAINVWKQLLVCGPQEVPVWEVEKDKGIKELIEKGLVQVANEGFPQRKLELVDMTLMLGKLHKKVLDDVEKEKDPVAVSSLILSLKKAGCKDALPVIKRLIDLSLIEFDKKSLSLTACS